MKPYVVSADIQTLLARWANDNGFCLPPASFMSELRDEFFAFMQSIFPAFEIVPEDEIVDGLRGLVSASGLTPVALDRAYLQAKWQLDLARCVDADGKDCGLRHRFGAKPFWEQCKILRDNGLTEIVLVDDVIFSGDMISRMIDCFSRFGIKVPVVCAGVGIGQGIARLDQLRCQVHCVRVYSEVIDQVCERDFYPGVPFCGRLLVGSQNIGVPYILPFGNPHQWASVPIYHQVAFSQFCVRQTISLFEAIEQSSNRVIRCSDLGRMVVTFPQDSTRYLDVLKKIQCL